QEEAACALCKRAAHVAGAAECGEDECSRLRQLTSQLAGSGDAVESGHLDVEKRDVGPSSLGGSEHMVAAIELGHDLDVLLEPEQPRGRPAPPRWILGNKDANHAPARGTGSRSRKPPPGGAPASSSPRMRCARSRSPCSPLPCPVEGAALPSSSISIAAR